MISLLKLYGRAARGFYGAAAGIVALKSMASLLEALGLVLLLQLLGGALRGPSDPFATVPGAKVFLKVIGSVPVDSHRGIVVFAAMGLLAVLLKFLGEVLLCVTLSGAEESLRRRHSRAVVGIQWESFLRTRLGNSSDFLLARGAHLGLAVNSFIYFISETLSAVLCFAIALVVAPTMTLTIGGIFFAVTFFLRRIGGRLERHYQALPQAARVIGELTMEFLSHLKFIRSVGRGTWALSRLNRAFAHYRSATFYIHLSRNIPQSAVEVAGVLFIVGIFLAGVRYQLFPLAEGISFLALFYRLAPRVQMAFSHFAQMRAREPLIADLLTVDRQMESFPSEANGTARVNFSREIVFENVQFQYQKEDSNFGLGGISLRIEPGRCVALVGESGAGKSTVLDLLTGLLEPTSGSIRIDGLPLREIDRHHWREQIGLVPQEIPVFEGTLAENLVWEEGGPDPVRLRHCLQQASLTDFVDQLPKGLETEVGPGGMRLSGGQRQRLALARALYRDPSLLVLDEATSSLDSSTELMLQDELKQIRGTVAMLIVAHRLKTVEMADEILVLQKGFIVERGTWTELLNRRTGVFARMAAEQGISTTDSAGWHGVPAPEIYRDQDSVLL